MTATCFSKFRRIILVNWRDMPFAQIDLDSNVTVLEGDNGSGKTSIMLAALATLMPDRTQLRSRKVSGESHAIEAIFHRLEMDEPIAYAALEIELRSGLFLAGVQITKQKESSSIELEPITIQNWPDKPSVQDFFRVTEDQREWTCNLSELKQRAGEWGLHLQAHSTLISYFKELYDVGALPLLMATDAERSQYAHLLETSMVGGLSAELAVKLKHYLLPEYDKLPTTVKLMHDNLRACIETQTELNNSEAHYNRIGDLFQSLTIYMQALGARVHDETTTANENLRKTEEQLADAQKAFETLEQEQKKWSAKKAALETERAGALARVQKIFEDKSREEDEITANIVALRQRCDEGEHKRKLVNASTTHLAEAIETFKALFPDTDNDLSAARLEAKIKTEDERIYQEMAELHSLREATEKERADLQKQDGVSPDIAAIAKKVKGLPVLQRYRTVSDVATAARLQAKLGPLAGGLIVKDVDAVAKQVIAGDTNIQELWLTDSEDPAASSRSVSIGDFEIVNHTTAVRATRVPRHPIVGEAARVRRAEELKAQIKKYDLGSAELKDVKERINNVAKQVHRVADEHHDCMLSVMQDSLHALAAQLASLESQVEERTKQRDKAKEDARTAHADMQKVLTGFKRPEDEINSELRRNEIAGTLNSNLRERLSKQRTDGIAVHGRWKPVWDAICDLPGLSRKIKGSLPDIGGSLERLRNSLQQIPSHNEALALLPEFLGDEIPNIARQLPTIRESVLALIRIIQPHDLTDSDDPDLVIDALTKKISTLRRRLDEQQNSFRTSIDAIATAIYSEIHKRSQAIIRWSSDLRDVQFGTVRGIKLTLEKLQPQLDVLDSLRTQKELFAQSKLDPKTALQEFWKERTGQELTAENALDYRRFVKLVIEVGDVHGKWRPVGGSTGEMVGAALSILIILLRAWEEEAAFRGNVDPLRLLFLDEAGRLSEPSQATLESLSTSLGIQFLVAAPTVAGSGRFTHYVLERKTLGQRDRVFIRGRRKFCEPQAPDSKN